MPNILILHPDLGIGGAERLIVDIALALKTKKHNVHIVTSHHDRTHCFEETRNGHLDVTVVGDWIPRNVFGRLYALMAYIRMLYAAVYILFCGDFKPDVIICDLVSVAIPILKLKCANVLFYCHHPDQLLSQPGGTLKSFYRAPLNWWEEITTGQASQIFVNSKYTASVFKKTFTRLTVEPEILYPSLNTDFFDSVCTKQLNDILPKALPLNSVIFLSINRYERKKDLSLALHALKQLEETCSTEEWEKIYLIMAGGYDARVDENVEHFAELLKQSTELHLTNKVIFLKSPKDVEKVSLLKSCTCLVYTPTNEHFGIVPIEAMYLKKPVIAANSGGPKETVVNNETGFLAESTAQDFATAMLKFIKDSQLSERFGSAGHNRVTKLFSFNKFASQIDNAVNKTLHVKSD